MEAQILKLSCSVSRSPYSSEQRNKPTSNKVEKSDNCLDCLFTEESRQCKAEKKSQALSLCQPDGKGLGLEDHSRHFH